MSNITLSVLMTVLWSGLFALLIHTEKGRRSFWKSFGSSTVPILLVLASVRCAFPFYSGLVWKIYLKGGWFAAVYQAVVLEHYTIVGGEWSILNVLVLVWMLVSLGLLCRFCLRYRRNFKAVGMWEDCQEEAIRRLWQKICKEETEVLNIQIKISDQICAPMGMGVFQKVLLLPKQKFTEQELYYMLLHEWTHFCCHDHLLLIFMEVCRCAFWWNPFWKVLYRAFLEAIEIRCDAKLLRQIGEKEQRAYLKTIVRVLRSMQERDQMYGATALTGAYCRKSLTERFQIAAEDTGTWGKRSFRRTIWTAALAVSVVLSFSVMLYPSYDPTPEDLGLDATTYEVTPENAYLVWQEDGTYLLRLETPGQKKVEQKMEAEAVEQLKRDGFLVQEKENLKWKKR